MAIATTAATTAATTTATTTDIPLVPLMYWATPGTVMNIEARGDAHYVEYMPQHLALRSSEGFYLNHAGAKAHPDHATLLTTLQEAASSGDVIGMFGYAELSPKSNKYTYRLVGTDDAVLVTRAHRREQIPFDRETMGPLGGTVADPTGASPLGMARTRSGATAAVVPTPPPAPPVAARTITPTTPTVTTGVLAGLDDDRLAIVGGLLAATSLAAPHATIGSVLADTARFEAILRDRFAALVLASGGDASNDQTGLVHFIVLAGGLFFTPVTPFTDDQVAELKDLFKLLILADHDYTYRIKAQYFDNLAAIFDDDDYARVLVEVIAGDTADTAVAA